MENASSGVPVDTVKSPLVTPEEANRWMEGASRDTLDVPSHIIMVIIIITAVIIMMENAVVASATAVDVRTTNSPSHPLLLLLAVPVKPIGVIMAAAVAGLAAAAGVINTI